MIFPGRRGGFVVMVESDLNPTPAYCTYATEAEAMEEAEATIEGLLNAMRV